MHTALKNLWASVAIDAGAVLDRDRSGAGDLTLETSGLRPVDRSRPSDLTPAGGMAPPQLATLTVTPSSLAATARLPPATRKPAFTAVPRRALAAGAARAAGRRRWGESRGRRLAAAGDGAPPGDEDCKVIVEKSGATVFSFVDPTEALAEEVKALAAEVTPLLKGVSVTVVGDNGDINVKLAELLAPLFEYVPLSTRAIFEQLTSSSVESVLAEEGWPAVAGVEAVVAENLADSVRTAVATLGGGQGAAARGDVWRFLFGHVCVWVEEVAAPGEAEVVEERPQNDAYAQAEVQVKVVAGREPGEVAAEALPQVLSAMKALLQREDDAPGLDLAGKKLLYIKLGIRGDWPDIMPPEWQPDDAPAA
eukprot:jgi/Tetstr1/442308/TSEL_030449.t1